MVEEKETKKGFHWSTVKKVLHFITSTIMYAVFLILIFIGLLMIMYVIDAKKNAASGVYKPPLFSAYVIISNSMVPTIKVQDAVVVKRVDVDRVKVGDIITFTSVDDRYSGLTITHRVVGIEKTSTGKIMFRTKGDNNNVEDSTLVAEEYFNGRVILKIPKIGYIQYFLSQAYGWIIAIVIPCLGIVIYDILKLVKVVKKNVVKSSSNKKLSKKKEKEEPPKRVR